MPANKKEPRFAAWRARMAERLARSSRVFLLGIIVACGIEVVVDWNQTLFEINVLRAQIHLKGVSYASLLSRAIAEPMRLGRTGALSRLADGILDDEDAVLVRVVDGDGKVVFDRIEPAFEKAYARLGKGSYREHYAHWLDRDLRGVIADPDAFRARLQTSRYRDLPQIYSDATMQLMAQFVPPAPLPASRAEVVYQDRLRDENHRRDDSTSWAIAPFERDGKRIGAVLVAFDMERTNRAVGVKYLKGAGMTIFFVALILIQNVLARRDKLRLLDLERRYASAKTALRQAIPAAPIASAGLVAEGALEQAKGAVDGVVWDAVARPGGLAALVVDPDGDGIDAAAIGLHLLRTFRRRHAEGAVGRLEDELVPLGAATHDIPLTRPIGLLLLDIDGEGRFQAVLGDFASLHIATASGCQAVAVAPREGDVPDGMVGPLFRCEGTLPAGAVLVAACAGKGIREARLDGDALGRYLVRSLAGRGGGGLNVDDVAIWIRGRSATLAENDIAVVAIRRG